MRLVLLPLRLSLVVAVIGAALAGAPPARAQSGTCCVVPDNGSGTADLPPSCSEGYDGSQMEVSSGLPSGSTLEGPARMYGFFDITYLAGGPLGDQTQQYQCFLDFEMTGTGAMTGYHRLVTIPLQCQSASAPRGPAAAPVQDFDTEMMTLQGQLPPGDPDFDLLRISAGTDLGLPSPGHTTLTQESGPAWAVDSFFDITYRIDFIGSSGGPFGGMSGSTTAAIRMQTCESPVPTRSSTWGAIKRLYQ